MADARRGIPWLLVLPPLIFVLFVAIVFYGMQRDAQDPLTPARTIRPAPPLTLEPLGDYAFLTREMLEAPGVKLVNFWGAWCVACRAEHPTLMWMSRNLGVPIYGIDFDDSEDKALEYLAERGNPYAAQGQAVTAQTKIDWEIFGAPETFIIDGRGRVANRYAGPITRRVLEQTIMPMIEEARKIE